MRADPDAPQNIWDATWVYDTSFANKQKLVPDAEGKIYDRDAPDIGSFGATDSYERKDNFRQCIKWGATKETAVRCSDYVPWSWHARWKKDANPVFTLTSVSTIAVQIPGEDDAFYKYWVSGTITKGGNPLAGVTVTCGGKTATTAANGTYTIKGIAPGAQTVTPTKNGETFTPASRNLSLTGTVVNGRDFVAN